MADGIDDVPEHEHPDEMEVVDSTTFLESREAVIVRKECAVEGCNYRLTGVDVRGDRAGTVEDLHGLAYELYESFYDNPRSVGYFTLNALIESGEDTAPLPAVDYLAAAVDLGVRHKQDGGPKHLKEEVWDALPDLEVEDG